MPVSSTCFPLFAHYNLQHLQYRHTISYQIKNDFYGIYETMHVSMYGLDSTSSIKMCFTCKNQNIRMIPSSIASPIYNLTSFVLFSNLLYDRSRRDFPVGLFKFIYELIYDYYVL